MSGFTTVLEATGEVYDGINVLTIAIADGFDGNYPSWLLLGQGSMRCTPASGGAASEAPSGQEGTSGTVSVTPLAACLKRLAAACPCGNAARLRQCVRRQVESKCSPPPAGRARTSYTRALTRKYAQAKCRAN
jgi:hypothetical protein